MWSAFDRGDREVAKSEVTQQEAEEIKSCVQKSLQPYEAWE
jgi:hypothetical protein